MRGIVFVSFMDLVEETFGLEVADRMIQSCDLASGGIYTSVGEYDHQEIMQMVGFLHKETDLPVADLEKVFGKYLFGILANAQPRFLDGIKTAFDLLEKVDSFIHVEVKKLYPNAMLPEISCTRLDNERLEMFYSSPRCLGNLAEGLIQGCVEHFGEPLSIQHVSLSKQDEANDKFILERVAA